MLSFMTYRRTCSAAMWLPLVAMLLLSGCGCWFMPCDRNFRLSGHVLELDGRPVNGATVEIHDVGIRRSCVGGCFSLTLSSGSSGSELVVSKEGYRPYTGKWHAGDYDVTVHLAPVSGSADSSATWHEVAAHVTPVCADVDCN